MKSIRGLVVAAFAVAALVAVPAAASASAGFEASKEEAGTLQGRETSTIYIRYGANVPTICEPGANSLTFEAAMFGRANIVTTNSVVNPKCFGGSLGMNGCQLELDPAGVGSVGIGPAGCGSAKYTTEACYGQVFLLPAGTKIDAAYENIGSGKEAKVMIKIHDLEVSSTTSGGGCGGAGTKNLQFESGTLEVEDTSNTWKEQIGFRMVPGDIFMGGIESPMMEAPEYPSRMSGEASEGGLTTLWEGNFKIKVNCTGAIYNGNGLPSSELSLGNISYSGCSSPLGAATATASGCQYQYSGLKYLATGEYDAAAKINCSGSIKIVTGGCTITMPSQTLSARTKFVNKEVANDAAVIATMTGSSVKYSAEGANCGFLGISKSGTYENASIHSDILLRGGV
jgi:hypothetical protein